MLIKIMYESQPMSGLAHTDKITAILTSHAPKEGSQGWAFIVEADGVDMHFGVHCIPLLLDGFTKVIA